MEKSYPEVGHCIYCGRKSYSLSRARLGDEHIVPEALGGSVLLPRASCQKCEGIINKWEQFCHKQMMLAFRIKLNLPSKRLKDRPNEIMALVERNGIWRTEGVLPDEFPLVLMVPKFPTPEMIRPHRLNKSELETFFVYPKGFNLSEAELFASNDRYGHGQIHVRIESGKILSESGKTNANRFARMVAKIAYAYGIAELGPEGFSEFITPVILGDNRYPVEWYVGGDSDEIPASQDRHELTISHVPVHGRTFVVVGVRLFADLGWPQYRCVIGVAKGERPRPVLKMVKPSPMAAFSMPRIVMVQNSPDASEPGLDTGFDHLCATCGDVVTSEFVPPTFVLQCGTCGELNVNPPMGRAWGEPYHGDFLAPEEKPWPLAAWELPPNGVKW